MTWIEHSGLGLNVGGKEIQSNTDGQQIIASCPPL